MDSVQNYKARRVDKQIPGCLGRMVNLFDLSAGVSANRLVTDKPHREGPLSRSQSDAARMSGPSSGNKMDNKMVTPDLRNLPCSKSRSLPMKLLIVNEMSEEIESKHSSPNLVAKLMGLDALPQQQPGYVKGKSQSKGYAQCTSSQSDVSAQHWPQNQIVLDKRSKYKPYQNQEHNDYKDVYEVKKESQKISSVREKSLPKRSYLENESKKKMDLVHQKFVEAKRLATSEQFSQSKQFQDAVEVLSFNKEFFLKFLQEPNGLISKSQRELQSIFAPPETKRITVLRPSKLTDDQRFPELLKKDEILQKGPVHERGRYCISPAGLSYDGNEYSSQPTQIVVLKPSAGKMQEIRSSVSLSFASPVTLHGDDTLEDEPNEIGDSRQFIKESIRHRHKNLLADKGNDSSTYSALSNGYGGDSSSFNKSEDEFATENFSDSEVVSPTSRHSWSYLNRVGTPFSSSSLSRASYSPESSVCREAKKRLSERWSMMASNGQTRERRKGKNSNTLGEMLALSDANKPVRNEKEGNLCQPRVTEPCSTENLTKDLFDVPRNLPRSKSLPSSPSEYGERINLDLSGPKASGVHVLKEPSDKTIASSLKGKVSSLLLSRIKKSNKERSSQALEESQSTAGDSDTLESSVCSPSKVDNSVHQFAEANQIEERSPPGGCGLPQQMSIPKPVVLGNAIENQDQPSPISVLEPLSEEDGSATPESSGKQLGVNSRLSNLIGKSPLIESVARTLTWDDSSSEGDSPVDHTNHLEHDEQEWVMFINDILFAAGLNGGFTFKWHSPETPLDPSLRNKYSDPNEEEEARKSQRRSNRMLAFDCVNAALADITTHCGFDSDGLFFFSEEESMVDRLWGLMREWREGVVVQFQDKWDGSSLVVESMVRMEVVGGVWAQQLRLEINNMGKQIEVRLMQELVEEIVGDLRGTKVF